MASAEIEQRSGLSTGLTGMFIAAGMLIVALVLGHMGRSYKATRTVRLDRPLAYIGLFAFVLAGAVVFFG
ncbi:MULTISPECIES: hypothetical protein [Pseudomonas]|jgi:hypothetical protein|uniref:Uncharacterized protein n=2 Tax=Pseudomonas TaxID=286 RepID=A0A2X2F786_PSELU|nr:MULTISPECIES: hypothetical protein [Pseudomonas]ENA28681.1 hypothetical protein HMPREF1487_08670 [Pseudomonas sp. HPB0071]MBF8643682.1 hypothetical protein [Pseudomonas zeshuii]MBW5415845.1 hypothetical protein [Pseudomonas sp. MAG002Y]SHI49485.1 hypothetical protein SAMN05216295_1029 [Pseudomonas zeshuii]SPZ16569.1 Uncharacterised protein [Pseudomonas luteola]